MILHGSRRVASRKSVCYRICMTRTKRLPQPLRLDDHVTEAIKTIAARETEGNFSMAARKLLNEALTARGRWPAGNTQDTTEA